MISNPSCPSCPPLLPESGMPDPSGWLCEGHGGASFVRPDLLPAGRQLVERQIL
jgi:hypothetical protein